MVASKDPPKPKPAKRPLSLQSMASALLRPGHCGDRTSVLVSSLHASSNKCNVNFMLSIRVINHISCKYSMLAVMLHPVQVTCLVGNCGGFIANRVSALALVMHPEKQLRGSVDPTKGSLQRFLCSTLHESRVSKKYARGSSEATGKVQCQLPKYILNFLLAFCSEVGMRPLPRFFGGLKGSQSSPRSDWPVGPQGPGGQSAIIQCFDSHACLGLPCPGW